MVHRRLDLCIHCLLSSPSLSVWSCSHGDSDDGVTFLSYSCLLPSSIFFYVSIVNQPAKLHITMKTKFSFLRGSLHLDRVLPAILKVIMSRVTVQTKRMLIIHCTCIEKIKMAGRFYGDITPRCIGRTS